MTVDFCLQDIDDEFLDEIDEIMEDTMIQIFVVHVTDREVLERIKKSAKNLNALYYAVTVDLQEDIDENCIGYIVEDETSLSKLKESDKAILVEENSLSEAFVSTLKENSYKGIIFNATHLHEELENFYLSLGAKNISKIEPTSLEKISMDSIVLQSTYPEFSFESITDTVKVISDTLFRPEQSIIARATKSSLNLLNLYKGQ